LLVLFSDSAFSAQHWYDTGDEALAACRSPANSSCTNDDSRTYKDPVLYSQCKFGDATELKQRIFDSSSSSFVLTGETYWYCNFGWAPPLLSVYPGDHWFDTDAEAYHACLISPESYSCQESFHVYDKPQCMFSQATYYRQRIFDNSTFVVSGAYYYYCPWGWAEPCPPDQTRNSATGICELSPKNNGGGCKAGNINFGNPINGGTSNKWQHEIDLLGNASYSLTFERYYNASMATNNGDLGSGWVHSYTRSISMSSDSSLIVYRQDGKAYNFNLNAGVWMSDADVADRLEEVKNSSGTRIGWRYTIADQTVENYYAGGKLQSIVDLSGYTQTLTYSDASTPASIAPKARLLIRVTDSFGRQLNFTYDANSRLSTLTDPAGGLYQYAYDADSNLSTVTYPDDTPGDATDNPKKTYVYGELSLTANVSQPHALTGIIDENNRRYATYTYDAQSRAVSTEHAGGAGRVSLAYNSDGSTTVTDALNTPRTYHFTAILGVVKSAGSDQPGGSGCGAASSALSYDANGNVASRTDFNGNRSCYTYNSRNLETIRLEGLASGSSCPADLAAYTPTANSSERKISIDWHATFRLPVKLTEPGLETTYGYDDHGQVTLKSLKDLNTLQTRSWSIAYTYSPAGILLSKVEDGPRTDVSDVTTYDYYPEDATCTGGHFGCRGQLKQVTDALGHITQISRYNAHSQPEELIDPNGLVTTLVYDARQRLKSLTVGSETTSYSYDPAGLLTRITGPDGAYLAYTYDDAHRLTGITDQLGNTVTYTLDALGNRTKEDVRDPTGQLARSQSRVYDALSRLQNLVLPE
jgi:YD repeat-containing protein